jgi:hypothetical protein
MLARSGPIPTRGKWSFEENATRSARSSRAKLRRYMNAAAAVGTSLGSSPELFALPVTQFSTAS